MRTGEGNSAAARTTCGKPIVRANSDSRCCCFRHRASVRRCATRHASHAKTAASVAPPSCGAAAAELLKEVPPTVARAAESGHSSGVRSRRHQVHSREWRRRRCALPQAVSAGIGLSDRSSCARSLRLQRGSAAVPLRLFRTAIASLERGTDSRFASGKALNGDVAAHVAVPAPVWHRISGGPDEQPVALGAHGAFSAAPS